MENAITGFIVMFIIIFGVFTLTESTMGAQDSMSESWSEMAERLTTQSRIRVSSVNASTRDNGGTFDVVLENDGDIHLADFSDWDVIVQYVDQVDGSHHVDWLPYTKTALINGTWTVEGIYLDVEQGTKEVFEPAVLNPGEQILLTIKSAFSAEAGSPILITIATDAGTGTSDMFYANILPVVAVNNGVLGPEGGSVVIDNTMLLTTDEDDDVEVLKYAITIPPSQGSLSQTEFFQTDINDGALSYTHSGTGDDNFQFTVTDGKDVIGSYVFFVTISQRPQLISNGPIVAQDGETLVFNDLILLTSDEDDAAENLVYTVTSPPTLGSLNLGTTFTQADINGGALTYTHQGVGDDSFSFTVSDGESEIGPYTFVINHYAA